MKDKIVKDLEAAMSFLNQAQNRCLPGSDSSLWVELDNLYLEILSLKSGVELGGYDDSINVI